MVMKLLICYACSLLLLSSAVAQIVRSPGDRTQSTDKKTTFSAARTPKQLLAFGIEARKVVSRVVLPGEPTDMVKVLK